MCALCGNAAPLNPKEPSNQKGLATVGKSFLDSELCLCTSIHSAEREVRHPVTKSMAARSEGVAMEAYSQDIGRI